MKKTQYDPILTEMHSIKDAISAEFNHDIDALFDHLKTLERKAVTVNPALKTRSKRTLKRPLLNVGTRRRKVAAKVTG